MKKPKNSKQRRKTMKSEKPKQWHPGCQNSQSAALLSPLVRVCVSGRWEWADGGRRGLCHCRPWGPGLLWLEPGWVVSHWGRPFWGGMDLLIWFSILQWFFGCIIEPFGVFMQRKRFRQPPCNVQTEGGRARMLEEQHRGITAPLFLGKMLYVHSKFWHWSSLVRDFWHS